MPRACPDDEWSRESLRPGGHCAYHRADKRRHWSASVSCTEERPSDRVSCIRGRHRERASEVHPGCAACDRARGAQAQVRCARPACYHGKYYGGPNVRNPITAQYEGANDLGGGVTQKGQPLSVYQKTAETA